MSKLKILSIEEAKAVYPVVEEDLKERDDIDWHGKIKWDKLKDMVLSGGAELWILDEAAGGYAITYPYFDTNSEESYLALYAVVALRPLTPEIYELFFQNLYRYCASIGCAAITAITANKKLAEGLKNYGANVYSLIHMPLKEN
jgi:hypothetical protein